jgi:hypothetical protein
MPHGTAPNFSTDGFANQVDGQAGIEYPGPWYAPARIQCAIVSAGKRVVQAERCPEEGCFAPSLSIQGQDAALRTYQVWEMAEVPASLFRRFDKAW